MQEQRLELLQAIMTIVHMCNDFRLIDKMKEIISLDDIYDNEVLKKIAYEDEKLFEEICQCFREQMSQGVLNGGFNVGGFDSKVYGADAKYYEKYGH